MAPGTDRTQYREVLASLVLKTQTRFPALNGRLTTATKLALLDDVALNDDGSATVHSASDPTRHYRIVEDTCTCRDYEQAPEHLCQHRLAAGLVRKAKELLAPSPGVETATTPAPDGVKILDSTPAPLPEAPASCNVFLSISGHKVQVTLRDGDEQRMLERLQILLDKYPVAATAPQTASQGPGQLSPQQHNAAMYKRLTGFCAVHNVPMQENHKDGRTWWSHKTADGWCKGK